MWIREGPRHSPCDAHEQTVWRAAAHKRPCALVLADLVKAFDRVLRAVVMGDSSINSEDSSG